MGKKVTIDEDDLNVMAETLRMAKEMIIRIRNERDYFIKSVQYIADEKNWEEIDDARYMLRPGRGKTEGFILTSRHLCPWIFARNILEGKENE